MSISKALNVRCESKCELCSSDKNLSTYNVPPKLGNTIEEQIACCEICLDQINDYSEIKINHWRCLNDAIWNPEPSVQVVAYRMLQKLKQENWAEDLLGMMYIEDSTLEWANNQSNEHNIIHKDSNGNILENGDTVVLIKDLNVKGSSLTAKRGTAVRRIRLDPNNEEYIEGKVDGQHIVILTKFVKK